MKQIAAIIACIMTITIVSAQNKKHHKASAESTSAYFKKSEAMVPGVWGTIKDGSGEPMADVEAMVYSKDTILASGFTNEDGHFMTNTCREGKYIVRIIYPNSNKYLIVNGVEIKKGRCMLNIKTNAPTVDSSVSFAELNPKKKVEKKGDHHKK